MDMSGKAGISGRTDSWRWFPIGIIGALAFVAVVNAGMVYSALHTFPGSAGEDGYDLSNSYDRVLKVVGAQAELGWHVHSAVDTARHAQLRVTDSNGQALSNAVVTAQAERPVGPPETIKLTLQPNVAGLFVAAEALPPGQWLLGVTVEQNGKTFSTTERLITR
jgi:nitrogen fixation protein FixH